jgi:uncharacterized protein YndB with AHSA1/START domain
LTSHSFKPIRSGFKKSLQLYFRHDLLEWSTKTMRYTFLIALVVVALSAQTHVRVSKQAHPEKALSFEVQVPASRDRVWTAFTTSDGLSTWLTPGAVVDLRKGGEWAAHFPGGATGGGTILDFTPKMKLVMSAKAPPKFPHVAAERTTAIWTFETAGDQLTRVRLYQTGWKEGEEWDKAYDYLAVGNAQLLETLRRRFESGPIDWGKEWGTTK